MKLNLAPDVYQASQRAKRLRAVVTSIGAAISVISIGLVVVGLVVLGGQKVAIKKLQSDIKEKQNQVDTYADLPAAVTAQQHLLSLNQLYTEQIQFSRFFSVLQELAPQGVGVMTIGVGADNSLDVSASARSYDLVTKFTKALEAANVTLGNNASASQTPYFTEVNLQGVSDDGGGVSFKLQAKMSPEVTTRGN